MEKKEFKKLFGGIAVSEGFSFQCGFWNIASNECILTFELIKSNFGNFYYLCIKSFVQGAFGREYTVNKDLVKGFGHASARPPNEYSSYLDLDSDMETQVRKEGIELLFTNFVMPFTAKALTKKGIYELAAEERIILMAPVKKELDLLTQ